MSRVFLSHTAQDKPLVRKVASELANAGLRVWLDEAEIRPGDSLIQKIAQGLEETKHVVAFVSERSRTSAWVEKELNVALTGEIHGRKLLVIPVRLDDCRFPPFLVDKYYADLRDTARWTKEIAKLLSALGARFWKLGSLSYYDAVTTAEETDFWRVPTLEEARSVRKEMVESGVTAKALWTSTWKDGTTSYAVEFAKGKRIPCFAADHFGSIDCVLVPR